MNAIIHFLSILCFQMFIITVSLGQDEKTYRPVEVQKGTDSCIVSIKRDNSLQVFAQYTYDSLARIIEFSSFDKFKNRKKMETFKYDENGNLIELFSHDLPDEGAQFSGDSEWLRTRRAYNRRALLFYTYDTNNRLVNETKYSASYDTEKLSKAHNSYVCEYIYNDNGCLIKKIEAWPLRRTKKKGGKKDAIKIDTTYYVCDDRNNQISEIGEYFTGVRERKLYFYNEADKIIKCESFYGTSKEPSLDLYEYDSLYNFKKILDIDRAGNINEEHIFYYQDTLLLRYFFKTPRYHEQEMFFRYDSMDRIVLSHKKELEGSGYRGGSSSSLNRYKYKYDSKDRLIEEKRYWKPSLFRPYSGKTRYFYNDKDQMIQDKVYDSKNELIVMNLYSYKKDTLYKKIELDADSSFVDAEVYFYDTLGVKKAREMYDEQGFVTLYQTYNYDEVGEEIGGVFYKWGYKEELFEFYYNKDGTNKSIHVTFKKGNKVIDSYELLYDYYKNE